MTNHLHLIISAEKKDLSDILRDFKKYTSNQVIKATAEHASESRKEWMLQIFRKAGNENVRNKTYQWPVCSQRLHTTAAG